MKRFIAALVGALTIAAILTPAYAQTTNIHTAPHKIREKLQWITSQINVNTAGIVDSTVFTEGGSANATRDTSEAISMVDWIPSPLGYFSSIAADTAFYFQVDVQPAPNQPTGVTAALDSCYWYFQVSLDGVNWVSVTTTGIVNNGLSLQTSSNAGASIVCKLANTVTLDGTAFTIINSGVAGSKTAPTQLQWAGWPYLRVIVRGDMTGRFEGYISHFTTLSSDK